MTAPQLNLHERAAFVAVLLTFIRIHTVTTMIALRNTIMKPTGIATNSKALPYTSASVVSLVDPGMVGVGVVTGWEEGRGTKVFANRGIVHALVEANDSTETDRVTPLTLQAPGTGRHNYYPQILPQTHNTHT